MLLKFAEESKIDEIASNEKETTLYNKKCGKILLLFALSTMATNIVALGGHQSQEDNLFWKGAKYYAEGDRGMVLGTSGAPAIRDGIAVLKEGGSAADAALTTMLAQIALSAGSWVSYGGYFTMVYYDAKEKKVYSLNAGFRRPFEEDDPMSIPDPMSAKPTGRTALVPGLMAGVGEANNRFGRMKLARILEPAIRYAEYGFPMYPVLEELIRIKKKKSVPSAGHEKNLRQRRWLLA